MKSSTAARAPADLVFLLRIVPALPGMIRDKRVEPDIYDAALAMIAENRSDDFREWDDLSQVIRQEQALARHQAVARASTEAPVRHPK